MLSTWLKFWYSRVSLYVSLQSLPWVSGQKGVCPLQHGRATVVSAVGGFLKLLGKETIIPANANRRMFRILPVISLSAVATARILPPVLAKAPTLPLKGISSSYYIC